MTQDAELATRVREISRHGGLMRDHYTRVGTTGRLDTLQAAILSVKLEKLDGWTTQRRSIADWYGKHLAVFRDSGILALPEHSPQNSDVHVWALYTLRALKVKRGPLVERLRQKGVGAGVYYPKAISRQPSMAKFQPAECPNADRLANEVFSMPLFPELTAREFEFVVKSLGECLGRPST